MLKKWMIFLLAALLALGPAAMAETSLAPARPEAAWYDDAVFIGDSVGNQLRRYCTTRRAEGEPVLGTARFLTAGAYTIWLASLAKVLQDYPALQYRGRKVTVPQGLQAMEAGKAVIMLGLADEPGRNMDTDISRYRRMVDRIREVLPDIVIVAVSVTPVTKRAESEKTKQKNLDNFNVHLEALCEEIDVGFVDVTTALKTEEGFLNGQLSNDKKVHLNPEGLDIVIDVLYQFAAEQIVAEHSFLVEGGY